MENITTDGSQTFSFIAQRIGVPIDQVNFVLTQIIALVLAGVLRWKLHPSRVSSQTRNAFGLIFGLSFGYFCFGNKAIHIVVLTVLCYIPILIVSPLHVQNVVLVISLSYLSCLHIQRQFFDYEPSDSIDITGPIMVITQKVTSLAFSLHDGLSRKPEELSDLQKHQAVNKKPTALEYFGYICHFQTLMTGPLIFYRDYIDFIHGRHIRKAQLNGNQNGNHKENGHINMEPSCTSAVVKKLAGSILCAFVVVTFIPMYPIRRIKDEEFLESTTIFYKTWYLIMLTMTARYKYFFAWILADAICNNSGLGFNGYDQQGKPKWDLLSNVDIFKFETATNFREAIAAWNKGTNKWLRSLVYERTTRYSTFYTYTLSAFWHGFYPGYYLTFANAVLFTFAARAVRRYLRPHFLGSKIAKLFYDAVTMVTTRVVMAYITFSFLLLELQPSIKLYLHMYLTPHLFGIAAVTFLPLIPKPRHSEKLKS